VFNIAWKEHFFQNDWQLILQLLSLHTKLLWGIMDVAAPIQNNPTGMRKATRYTLKDVNCQYSETNVMHFLFSLLRNKSLYMFRALLAHPQEALQSNTWYTACVLCQLLGVSCLYLHALLNQIAALVLCSFSLVYICCVCWALTNLIFC
jgi:hypothetical protein